MESTDTEVLDAVPATSVAVLKYDAIEAGLAELRDASKEAFDVTTKEGNKAAREFVRRCVTTRTAAGDAYTNWNRPVMDIQKQAREKRDYIIGEVEKVEAPVKAQIDAEAQKKEEERIAKAREEAARIDAHQSALKAIGELPRHGLTATVAEINEALARLQSPDFLAQRDWEEYGDQAIEAVATAVETLRAHLANATAREELAAMRAQQEAEAAARRAEEEAAAAERRRVDGIKDRIRVIESAPTTCIGLGVRQIQQRIDSLAREAADDFAEFQADAGAAIEAALGNLKTMLDTARDVEDLAQLRADKARREQEEADAAARKAREEQEAREAEERTAREAEERRQAEARAAEEQRQRDEAESRRREQAAAEAAAARVRAQAGTLLALLTEARAHVPAGDLADRIDAAIANTKG